MAPGLSAVFYCSCWSHRSAWLRPEVRGLAAIMSVEYAHTTLNMPLVSLQPRRRQLARKRLYSWCSTATRAKLLDAMGNVIYEIAFRSDRTRSASYSEQNCSSSSMSNGATAAFRHMLQIGLHGACIASRGSHGLQRAFRGSLKLCTRGRVLGTYICSGVINSGHENTVAYSGCSASLSNRLRLGGNCATNFGQGSRGDTQNTSVGGG